MTDTITPEVFQHLVSLAALKLTAEEGEYLRQQLNQQLNSIDQLAAIPLDEDAPVTAHGIPYTQAISPAPREDIWKPYPNPEEILDQAPQVADRYFVVPEIEHTDL